MKTVGVQVLYNPQIESLSRNVEIIRRQVDLLVIIDNTTCPTDVFNNISNIEYLSNKANLGIAAAQNIGIKRAQELDAEFVVFFDQDSTPPENLVQVLIADYGVLIDNGYTPGVIGPSVINKESGTQYTGLIKNGTPITEGINEVMDIISSGSLVPASVFKKVGLMDADLFIDGVDHEFCWRATSHGFKSFQTGHAYLYHKVGEGDRSFGPIKILTCTPFRTYYIYRNYLLLSKRKYVPLYWKLSMLVKLTLRFIYFPIFVAPRRKHLQRALSGIKDGLVLMFRNQQYDYRK